MTQDLYLIIPAGSDAGRIVESFDGLPAGDAPQAVLYDPAGHSDAESKRVVKTIQAKNIAVIIKDDVEKALSLSADGVQTAYGAGIKNIRKRIGDSVLGVVCASRDEAMRAGDAGADYIGFDGDAAATLTQWWSELFTLPCVDFNVDHPSEAADFRIRILSF